MPKTKIADNDSVSIKRYKLHYRKKIGVSELFHIIFIFDLLDYSLYCTFSLYLHFQLLFLSINIVNIIDFKIYFIKDCF